MPPEPALPAGFAAAPVPPVAIAPLPPEPATRSLSDVRDSAVVLEERLILRGLRRVSPGINPAVEICQFLTEHAPHVHAVPIAGWVEVRYDAATFPVLASLQGYVENQADAWSYTAFGAGVRPGI